MELKQGSFCGSEALSLLICLATYNNFLLAKFLYSDRDDLPENLGATTAQERQKVHFRLMCVAQKRLCLSSLICLKEVVSNTQATVSQLNHPSCRFFLPLLCFFSSIFASPLLSSHLLSSPRRHHV